jgi:preprotein translocase subunit SecA
LFGFDTSIPEAQWSSAKVDDLVMHTYEEMKAHYAQRTERIAESVLPIMKDILENQGHQFENIALPISITANKQMQVVVNLRKGVESEGQEIAKEFEKGVVLNLIDDSWKEHLREMDDLKQSVQNAVYEQKDPLLIYKFESFELFNKMRNEVNRETVSTLLRAHIPVATQEGESVTQLTRKASIPTPTRNVAPSYTSSSTSGGKANQPQRKATQQPAVASDLPDFMRDALDQTVTSGPGQEAEERDLAAEAAAKKASSFDKFRKKPKR